MVWNAAGWPVVPHLRNFRDLWTVPELPGAASTKVHSTIVTALLWNIWKARNSWVFQAIRLP
jgi:hypothetical protein